MDRHNKDSLFKVVIAVALSVYALVFALIMHWLPEGVLRDWSAIFATIMGAIALLVASPRHRRK
jgi:uncharacterized membrane-anchored protein